MATMPPQAPMAQAAPMENEQAEMMEKPAAGYTICVRVAGDGSLSVGTEKESAEDAAEEYGAGSGFKPAQDIKEALTMALEIFKADGQAGADDAQFDAGFASRGGMQG